jgi:hypothetical protein
MADEGRSGTVKSIRQQTLRVMLLLNAMAVPRDSQAAIRAEAMFAFQSGCNNRAKRHTQLCIVAQ